MSFIMQKQLDRDDGARAEESATRELALLERVEELERAVKWAASHKLEALRKEGPIWYAAAISDKKVRPHTARKISGR